MDMSTSESFRREKPRPAKKKSIPKEWVRFSVDLENLPPLSKEQKARLAALKDRKIDFSDIPEAKPGDFQFTARGAFYKPRKDSITLRVDADVLAWFKSKGPGYQTLINALLRDVMLKEQKR
jgi:uncharacterized protein (DUF4415 family)